MARRTRRWVAAGTATLLGGLGLGLTAPPASAGPEVQLCSGMSAPQRPAGANQAPTPHADTVGALAGGTRTIDVLANDTDPDDDALYVVSAAKPAHGDVCVDSDGAVEYFATSSAGGYTDHIVYGVTDGDLYRTATVTVNVKGIKPLRAQLVHRKIRKHKATVRFANPNDRNMIVVAGSPAKKKAQLTRTIGVGRSVAFRTKAKKVVFFALVRDLNGEPIFVDVGVLNTRTGAQSIASGDAGFLRTHPSVRALQRAWVHK